MANIQRAWARQYPYVRPQPPSLDGGSVTNTSVPSTERMIVEPPALPPAYDTHQQHHRYPSSGTPLSPLQPTSSVPLTHTISSTTSSPLRRLKWIYHPSITNISSWNRFRVIYRSFVRQQERLNDDWVFESTVVTEEAKEAFQRKISYVNKVTPIHLVTTRTILAGCEILDYLVVILLIIGLAVEKGKQRGLLAGAEVFLVVVIICNALGMGVTRVRRYRLMEDLKLHAKDWSPSTLYAYSNTLRHTSTRHSTSSTFTNHAQSNNDDEPKLRWRVASEGGFWIGFRPIIIVEIMVNPKKRVLGHSGGDGEILPLYVPPPSPPQEGQFFQPLAPPQIVAGTDSQRSMEESV